MLFQSMINALGTDHDETEHAQAEDRSVSPVEQDVSTEALPTHEVELDIVRRRGEHNSEDDEVPELGKLQESSARNPDKYIRDNG